MAHEVVCVGCKWASWDRTVTGALHPNKDGKCTWAHEVTLPGAAAHPVGTGKWGGPFEFKAGYITRDQKNPWPKGCMVKET